MFQSLEGRVAIVTGASRGIGRGIARRFAEAGMTVIIVSRTARQAEDAAEAIGGRAYGFGADVSDPDGANAMARFCVTKAGRIDVLAANAGIFPSARLADMTVEDSIMLCERTLAAPSLACRQAFPT